MSMQPATVYIVDDDSAIRDALTLMIEQVGIAAETFDSAEAFLAACHAERRGCIIIDVRMPGMDGLQLQEELSRRGIKLPIVFLTGYGDIPMSVRAIKGGAVDFLTKPVTREQLLLSVQAAIRANEKQRAQAASNQQAVSRLEKLSSREREVMALAVQGYPNKETARRLGISHRTVEIHKASIMHKTGAANLLDLARIAQEAGPIL